MEAGLATPALAERLGGWAADPTQWPVLAMLRKDHGVQGSCTTLRTLLGSLSAGMAPHRPPAQVDQVVRWLHQARASQGRFHPTLSVGRDGVNVSMRHGDWQEGATAPVAVLDRGGKRRGKGPLAGGRVKDFRAGENYLTRVHAARDQNFSIL